MRLSGRWVCTSLFGWLEFSFQLRYKWLFNESQLAPLTGSFKHIWIIHEDWKWLDLVKNVFSTQETSKTCVFTLQDSESSKSLEKHQRFDVKQTGENEMRRRRRRRKNMNETQERSRPEIEWKKGWRRCNEIRRGVIVKRTFNILNSALEVFQY